jgi:flagellar hook-associated protein 3 FlgL
MEWLIESSTGWLAKGVKTMYVTGKSRITQGLMAENAGSQVSQELNRLYDLQQKIASGKKFLDPSDSPSGTSRALQLRSTRQANESYQTTANDIDLWISSNEASLQEITSVAGRTINLSFSAIGDTAGSVERDAVKNEIKALIRQVVNIGNTSHNDKYIFNGYQVNASTPPYSLDDTTMTLTNQPSDAGQTISQKYGPGQSMTINFNGETTVTPILNAMIGIYKALDAGTFNKATLQTAIDGISAAVETLKTNVTENGTRQREIKTQISYLERTDIEIRSLISNNEDINVAEAISELSIQQTTYQKSIQVSAKALSLPNLFDYL